MKSTAVQDLERWVRSKGYVKETYGPEAAAWTRRSIERAVKDAYQGGASLREIARITGMPEAEVSRLVGLGT